MCNRRKHISPTQGVLWAGRGGGLYITVSYAASSLNLRIATHTAVGSSMHNTYGLVYAEKLKATASIVA